MSTIGLSHAFGGTEIITFEWIPDPEKVAQELVQLSNALEDRSGPLALSQQIAIDDVRDHFDTKTSPAGAAWIPWADSYAYRAAKTNVGGILERTGALKSAATNPGAYPITADSVFFSTAGLPYYWQWNHEGTSGDQTLFVEAGFNEALGMDMPAVRFIGEGRGKSLPARPYIGISFEAQLKIMEVFEQWFNGAINTFYTTKSGRIQGRYRDPATGQFATPP